MYVVWFGNENGNSYVAMGRNGTQKNPLPHTSRAVVVTPTDQYMPAKLRRFPKDRHTDTQSNAAESNTCFAGVASAQETVVSYFSEFR